MRMLRTMPLGRLVAVLAAAAVILIAGAAAVVARGGAGSTPPPKPLADAIHDALTASTPEGITARIAFTNKLFPSGALTGQTGSALMSSASGRLWVNSHGGRLELQSDAGDTQITWTDSKVTVYDASSNTAYVADLPQRSAPTPTSDSQPTLGEITNFLTDLAPHWSLSDAVPSNIAGHEAYTVTVSPKHDGGLLGSAELAWDAVHGMPLDIAIYAQGASSPALALRATEITFGPVSDADITAGPPANTKVVDLSSHATGGTGDSAAPVTGLAAVQAAAPFNVAVPSTLVGLPLQDVRLVGPADSRAALAVYGQGLGAIVVVERVADASQSKSGGSLASLPSISLDGVTAHELATQLGTILAWQTSGVSYVLAGSVPAAAAEAAARAVK